MEERARALVLAQCLAAIERGESPECVAARYPALRDEILALLRLTSTLREAEAPAPSPAFLSELGTRLRQADTGGPAAAS